MFFNVSNHPYENWSADQLEEATNYGLIIDVPFPAVPSAATPEEVKDIALAVVNTIVEEKRKRSEGGTLDWSGDVAMVQGEFSLTYCMVGILKDVVGIKVVAATSERQVIEERLADGSTTKKGLFKFVQFREYERL